MKRITFYFLIALPLAMSAQKETPGKLSIIPQPVSVQVMKGTFTLSSATWICIPDSTLKNSAAFLNDYLQKYYGFKLNITYHPRLLNTIIINGDDGNDDKAGSYSLVGTKNNISIHGENKKGAFYAVQTLIQLLPVEKKKILPIPLVHIEDYPRFGYRGMHLDVSRHFFPVSYVKKYIDYIALHKMNYFHWHLTDDQGWRIEIKKYPRLTEIGGWRSGTIIGRYPGTGNDNIRYGGFYTQDQIREIVAYAAKRYITVIPEIDIPGHSLAMLAAYPQLGTNPDSAYAVAQTWGINGKFNNVLSPTEYTFNFVQDVFDEVMSLFPAPYIHIGGDEVTKDWWHQNAYSQQLIKDKDLKDEHGLQSYFIQRIEKYINSKGKKIIGWDEILEGGLAPNAVVMSWRGEQGGIEAARQHHYVIMTPESPLYLNHSQTRYEDSVTQGSYNPLEAVYKYDPIPKELTPEQGKYVLGAQGNVWSEYIGTPAKVEYSIFPRMSALSEVLWTPKEMKDSADFERRLLTQFKRYELWDANYSRAFYDVNIGLGSAPNSKGVLVTMSTKKKTGLMKYQYTGNKTELIYKAPFVVTKSGTLKSFYYDHNKLLNTRTQDLHFNKATGKKITLTYPAAQKYAGDGPFTLVNGVQNTMGLARSQEFLGFQGTDCEAFIDLSSQQTISKVRVHILNQPASWIWRPLSVEVFTSADGVNYTSVSLTDDLLAQTANGVLENTFPPVRTRYVKVLIRNWGTIPAGNPGAGTKPWLFVDEIEID